MKKIYCLSATLLFALATWAQNDYETFRRQYMQERQGSTQKYKKEQEDFKRKEQENFKRFRDSLNHQYAAFLKGDWKQFEVKKPEPLIKDPIPTPPIFDNTQPQPEARPVVVLPIKPKPLDPLAPVVAAPLPKPLPDPKPGEKPHTQKESSTFFFGTPVVLNSIEVSPVNLGSTAETDIAAYWEALAELPYPELMDEALHAKHSLQLNDWGLYLFLGNMLNHYLPKSTDNEKVIYSVFMLNQLGYKAKIGKIDNDLFALLVFEQEVSNSNYLTYENHPNTRYAVMNPNRKAVKSILSCTADYADASKHLDLRIATSPQLAQNTTHKVLAHNNEELRLAYNQNVADFYSTYPSVDFRVYAEADIDGSLLESIQQKITPKIKGKPEEEAVNWLLHFVQTAFEYQTDHEQFGYEKWFFAEETVASSHSDCEDRSILFAQLVRRLLGMPVVLVHYPGQHLATAVRFSNPETTGDYLMVDGQKYLICDPTYINANLGMSMPNLQEAAIELHRLDEMPEQ